MEEEHRKQSIWVFKCLSSLKMKCSFSEEIASHLASFDKELEWYFPEAPSYKYIKNPFSLFQTTWLLELVSRKN